MTLHTHRAERTDRLADDLAELLGAPLADPFATEVISVPTPGVERWLAQYLSHRLGTSDDRRGDGVAAGFAFWSLPRLVGTALAHLVDPDADPWQPDRLSWIVLAELDAVAAEPWAAPVANYLGYLGLRPGDGVPAGGYRQGRRWATARRLAGLFHRYGVQRPELIEHWMAGRDTDAAGTLLSPDRAWQPELWRRIRSRIGEPSGTERLTGACADLVRHPEQVDLPARVSVFGATRLTREQLRVLAALAEHRDIHLWLPHPSPVLWDRIADLPVADRPDRRRDDPSASSGRHPLLAYLSRDSRELQRALQTQLPDAVDRSAGPTPRPDTVLGRLQAGLTADTVPARRPLAAGDTSVAVHAAHGPDRQVEVLRDVLVGLLADDPALEPRDIVVMCPDIETFAPLIAAAFGLSQPEGDILGADHPGHRLRVRLADRSLRQINPLLGLVARLIDLAQSRVTASQVLDLCATEAVMRKFGLTDDDLDTIADLVRGSGVRWGLSSDHRERYGLGTFPHNTWRIGLDRILLGVTMDGSEGTYVGTTLPLDDVDSGDVDRVGRLVELLNRLGTVLDGLTGRHPLGHWLTVLTEAIEALAAVPSTEQWQLGHAYHALTGLAGEGDGVGEADGEADADDQPDGTGEREVLLGLADVRALLSDTLRGRPTRANFRTGSLTMCTMLPMRSVPHRVVCLLGVDDGVFPRRAADDGDDLLAADPWVGDRDPRSEDRQLLLDAVLAAEEQLVIIYSGADPRTNAIRPPAAPIGALLDALDATVVAPDGGRARDLVTVRHHLQPFDPGNFEVEPGPRSFDRAALAGARALLAARPTAPSPWLVDRLPVPPDTGPVSVDDLVRFFRHPVRAFLRLRAGLYVRDDKDADSDEIPIEPGPLDKWAIEDRLLRLRLHGVPMTTAVQAEWRRGSVPPKVLGSTVVDQAAQKVERIMTAASRHLEPPRRSVDVDLVLPHGRVTGTLNLHGDAMVLVGASRVRPKRLLDAWIPLLAVTVSQTATETAGEAHRDITAQVIGPGDTVSLGPVPGPAAAELLDDLLALYREGLCEPLPFAPNTAAEFAQGAKAGLAAGTLKANVGKQWGWEHDAAYGRFFGPSADDLVNPRSTPDGSLRPSAFSAIAQRVFTPLIGARG